MDKLARWFQTLCSRPKDSTLTSRQLGIMLYIRSLQKKSPQFLGIRQPRITAAIKIHRNATYRVLLSPIARELLVENHSPLNSNLLLYALTLKGQSLMRELEQFLGEKT